MKLNSTLASSLLAIAAAVSLNAAAASDIPADAKTEKADPEKPVKPDSGMEHKVGMMSHEKEQATAEKVKPKKINPAFDQSKHFHPRDGGKS